MDRTAQVARRKSQAAVSRGVAGRWPANSFIQCIQRPASRDHIIAQRQIKEQVLRPRTARPSSASQNARRKSQTAASPAGRGGSELFKSMYTAPGIAETPLGNCAKSILTFIILQLIILPLLMTVD
jgi:hypothetical protein